MKPHHEICSVSHVEGFFQLSPNHNAEKAVGLWRSVGAEVHFERATWRLYVICPLSSFATLPWSVWSVMYVRRFF